ncbi:MULTISPECIES: site-specific integrase [Flavobacterium]|uniref:site-specific integrase n=1 Tax=Flavobacterium TaxID=237 RepID=UPI0011826556|nr:MULTISPECIES: site-specific integrase [Flavobacterium]MCR4030699.1 site-specific integrase [Flavobacterium panacis]
MLKIYFFLKPGKLNWKNESPVYVRLWHGHDSITMATGHYITKERWDFTNKLRRVLRMETEKTLRRSLDAFQLVIEKKYNEITRRDEDFSLVGLKNELNGKTPDKITALKILELHIDYFSRKVKHDERSRASLSKYERSKDLLSNFINEEYKKGDVGWKSISGNFINKLELFLRYQSTFKGHIGIRNNSTVKYMRMYKTAFNYALKSDLITKNPFDLYEGKVFETDAVYLFPEELKTIETKEITAGRLVKTRDIFIFCCYTGYAPADASALKEENLVCDNNDDLWILANRTKTSMHENVPLLPPAGRIIHKYKHLQPTLLPSISNQKMNEYLKEIATLCGIKKKLTWYTARHTFATTVTLGNGIRIENVSSMMGHANILQTQHYAKVLDLNIKEDMKKLMDKYR